MVFNPTFASLALGRIVAYRGNAQTSPLDASTTVATASAITAVSVTGLTTTQDDDLIVAMCAGGQEAAWSSFGANIPGFPSGATDTTTAPKTDTWTERADSNTVTGADTSLAIFDAVKAAAGATGNLSATASLAAGHVVIAGAFKLAPPSTADAWNANDLSAGVTLSNSDKTATHAAGAVSHVKSTSYQTTGKCYVEISLTTAAPTTVFVGICKSTAVTSAAVITSANNGIRYANAGDAYGNAGYINSIGTYTSGDIISIAADLDNDLFWIRKNSGNWNNSGTANPATGVGGMSSATSGAQAVFMYTDAAGAFNATIRTEAAELTQTTPSGFLSWMGEALTVDPNVTVTPTGVSAATAVGTASVTAAQNVSIDATGVAATTALGTATASVKVSTSATGQTAATALGTPTVSGKANITGTGVSASAQAGTATATGVTNVSTTPAGVSAATAAGAVTVTTSTVVNVSVTPAGVSAAMALGTATATGVTNVSTTPASVAAATALGTATATGKTNISTTPASVAAATALGTVSASAGGSVSTTPAGVSAGTSLGTATATGKTNLSTTPSSVSAATALGTATATGASAPNGFSLDPGLNYAVYAEINNSDVVRINTAPPDNPAGYDNWYGEDAAVPVNVTVSPTGEAAGALLGAVTVTGGLSASVTPAGVSAAGALGTVTATAGIGIVDQIMEIGGKTLASAGDWRPLDTLDAEVAVTSIVSQVGCTRTWTAPGGKIVANGAPLADHNKVLSVATALGTINVTIKSSGLDADGNDLAVSYSASDIAEVAAAYRRPELAFGDNILLRTGDGPYNPLQNVDIFRAAAEGAIDGTWVPPSLYNPDQPDQGYDLDTGSFITITKHAGANPVASKIRIRGNGGSVHGGAMYIRVKGLKIVFTPLTTFVYPGSTAFNLCGLVCDLGGHTVAFDENDVSSQYDEALADGMQQYSGIYSATGPAWIQDNDIHHVACGISLGAGLVTSRSTDTAVVGNNLYHWYADCIGVNPADRQLIAYNHIYDIRIHTPGLFGPNNDLHPDCCQFANASMTATNVRVIGNRLQQGDYVIDPANSSHGAQGIPFGGPNPATWIIGSITDTTLTVTDRGTIANSGGRAVAITDGMMVYGAGVAPGTQIVFPLLSGTATGTFTVAVSIPQNVAAGPQMAIHEVRDAVIAGNLVVMAEQANLINPGGWVNAIIRNNTAVQDTQGALGNGTIYPVNPSGHDIQYNVANMVGPDVNQIGTIVRTPSTGYAQNKLVSQANYATVFAAPASGTAVTNLAEQFDILPGVTTPGAPDIIPGANSTYIQHGERLPGQKWDRTGREHYFPWEVITNVNVTPAGVSASATTGGVSVAVGGGVSTQPTGLALTATTGTATATGQQNVSTPASGNSAATQVGTPSVSVSTSVTPNGLTAASALGAATALGKQTVAVAVTGVSAAAALGGASASAGGSISITPAGVTASAQAGTPAATAKQNVTVTPVGVAAASQLGVSTASAKINISTMPAGTVVTTALGAVTVTAKINVNVMPVGVAAATALGGASVSAGGSITAAPVAVTAQAQLGTVTVTTKQAVTVTPAGVWTAAVTGTATAVGTTGGIGVWMGTAWQQKPVKVWTGSAWATKPPKTWTGSAWV